MISDAAICGADTITDGVKCGVENVTDGARCGFDTITDGARCGWDTFTSAAKCLGKGEFYKTGKCKIAKTCQVAKTCSASRTCQAAKSCQRVKPKCSVFPDGWKLEILRNVESNFKSELSALGSRTAKHFPQSAAFAQSADGQRLLGGLKQEATTFQSQREDAQRRFESLLKEQSKLEVLKRILVAVSQRKVDDALKQDVRKLDEWLVGDGKTRWAQAGGASHALQRFLDLFSVRSAHAASGPYPGAFSVVVNLNGGGGILGASISLGVVWDRNGAVKGVLMAVVLLGGIVDFGGDLVYRVHPGDISTIAGAGMGIAGSAAYYAGANALIEWSAPYTNPVPTWGYGVSVGLGAQVTWTPGATLVFPESSSTPPAAGPPTNISPAWPGLWADRVDAGLVWPGTNKAYFFRGGEYVRYDIASDKVDPGYPLPIANGWKGLWTDRVDAVVAWPNTGKVFFFRGSEYMRYDIKMEQVDPGYPLPIAGNWPGVWSDRVDAVVVWPGTNKAYFFRGSDYVRYDIASNKVDPGYPMSIASGWAGVFSQDLNEAIVWPNNKAYFFKGSQYVRYDISPQ